MAREDWLPIPILGGILILVLWALCNIGCVSTAENDGKWVLYFGTTISLSQEHPGEAKTSKTTVTFVKEVWDWLKMKHLEKADGERTSPGTRDPPVD